MKSRKLMRRPPCFGRVATKFNVFAYICYECAVVFVLKIVPKGNAYETGSQSTKNVFSE